MTPEISIIVPTLNEAENLPELCQRIGAALSGTPHEIVIVDDNSRDGTPGVCGELSKKHPLRLLIREKPVGGLSGAVLHGIDNSTGRIIVVMDADLQHPPEKIPELLAALEPVIQLPPPAPSLGEGNNIRGPSAPPAPTPAAFSSPAAPAAQTSPAGTSQSDSGALSSHGFQPVDNSAPPADFALGSRYISGGGTFDRWTLYRRLNSGLATLLAVPLCGKIHDPMSGFFALSRQTYSQAIKLNPLGYKIALELICKCRVKNVVEIPIHFDERRRGHSKLSFRQQLLYLRHIHRLYEFAFPLRFALVRLLALCLMILGFWRLFVPKN
jgi:glycosyltransferase involved in cell wall biosynthesis